MIQHDPKLFEVGRDREGFVRPLVDADHPSKGEPPQFWYIFRTFPNAEESVIEDFDDLGVHWWRAMRKERRLIRATRRCANPRHEIAEVSMYPGYLFAAMEPGREWPDLAGVDGLAAILRMASGSLAVVPSSEIGAIQKEIARGKLDTVKGRALFDKGSTVRIVEGPFIGFQGTVKKALSGQPVEVLVDILGAARPIAIQSGWVEAA